MRDNVLGWVYHSIIMPRMKEPVTGKEAIKELFIDEVSYEAFKYRAIELSGFIEETLLVHAIVSYSLSWTFGIADKTTVQDKIDSSARYREFLEEMMEHDDDYL